MDSPCTRALVENRSKLLRGFISDRPVGPDIIADAGAQEGLGQAHVPFQPSGNGVDTCFPARHFRPAEPSRFAGIEEDQRGQLLEMHQVHS